jgi:nucleoside-diphosphate-sugar epimerase
MNSRTKICERNPCDTSRGFNLSQPLRLFEALCKYPCSRLRQHLWSENWGLSNVVYLWRETIGVEDQGWLAWFVIATMMKKPITIIGNGRQVRDVLYVKDLVKGFDAIARGNVRQGDISIWVAVKRTFYHSWSC